MSTDSVFVIPGDMSLPSQPADTAGGQPADYTSQVLDLFKTGINAWSASKASPVTLGTQGSYQTTNGVVSLAGAPSSRTATGVAVASGISMTSILMIGAVVIGGLLLLKKFA